MIGVEGAFIFTIFVDQTLRAFFDIFLLQKIVSVGPRLSAHCMLYEVVSITSCTTYVTRQSLHMRGI